MLTKSTVDILNKLSAESDKLYSEGGLLYKYSYGHRCAHTDLQEFESENVENPIEAIESFLSSAIEKPFSDSPSPIVKEKSFSLLTSLERDFNSFQGPKVYLEEDDLSKTLIMIYTAKNDYHCIEFFWSID